MYSRDKVELVLKQLRNDYTSAQVDEVLNFLNNNEIHPIKDEIELAGMINEMSSDLARLFLLITFQTLNRNQISQELSTAIGHLKQSYYAGNFAQHVKLNPDTTVPEDTVKNMDPKTRVRFFGALTAYLAQSKDERLMLAKQKYSFLAMVAYLESDCSEQERVDIINGFEVKLQLDVNEGLSADIVDTSRSYIERLKSIFPSEKGGDFTSYRKKE